jgi:hypothetical protein
VDFAPGTKRASNLFGQNGFKGEESETLPGGSKPVVAIQGLAGRENGTAMPSKLNTQPRAAQALELHFKSGR